MPVPIYLDCNATTPPEPQVLRTIWRYMEQEYGNAASTGHDQGAGPRMAVETARARIARLLGARRDEVFFTSGATEANNLAILGLAAGVRSKRRHIISSCIEHKAVLEPLESLARRGFDIDLVGCDASGRVDPEDIRSRLRADTILVSLMAANNETGILQPLTEVAELLRDHPAWLHTDAAQAFGKEPDMLRHARIDMISISAHKIYGPKGVGALIARRRAAEMPPLLPLQYGGGQEQGLRPGTLPVPLIAGLGEAAALAATHANERRERCLAMRRHLLHSLGGLDCQINGDQRFCQPHVINLSLPHMDAGRAIVAVRDLISISSGSACTAGADELSHVLRAMGLRGAQLRGGLRLAWSHLTPDPEWGAIVERWSRNLHG